MKRGQSGCDIDEQIIFKFGKNIWSKKRILWVKFHRVVDTTLQVEVLKLTLRLRPPWLSLTGKFFGKLAP